MGAKCATPCTNKNKQHLKQFRDSIPDDIDNFHPQKVKFKLPKLSFQGTISNIKIINCPQNYQFSLKIKIDDVIEIDLPKRKVEPITELKRQGGQQIVYVQNQLKWISRQNISFVMDEYQLRSHFLNFYIYDDKKQIESHIRVNLFAIVTGPYRHDFYVRLKHHTSRLLFELNLSEKIQAKLEALQICIELQKSYLGEQFNFSLKQLTHGQVVSSSKISIPEKIPFQVNLQSTCYKQLSGDLQEKIQSPSLKRRKGKSSLVMMMESKSNLKWVTLSSSLRLFKQNYGEGDIQLKIKQPQQGGKKRLPHLKVFILSNQIMKSNIQLSLWIAKKKNFQDLPLKNVEKDSVIFGSTQINLYKIFDEEFSQIQAKVTSSTDILCPNFKLQVRRFVREENLYSKDGQILGECLLKFRLTNPKFFKQLNYCAKTEDGIINMTTAFKNYSGKSLYTKNNVIIDMIKISENIHSLTRKLSILQATVGIERRQIIKVEDQIFNQFDTMNKELINSFSSSFVFSSSNLELQLLEAQDALIQVLQQIFVFLVQKNGLYTDICWQVAVNIYKRGQFYLQNLGFKNFDKKQVEQLKLIKQKKLSVALRFKCILYKFLILLLEQDDQKKITGKILWPQCFKAFAYFRVPIFRKQVLEVLQRQQDQHLLEWKIPDLDEVNTFSSKFRTEYEKSTNHLDWKYYFYEPLQNKQQALKLDEELIETLEINSWIKSLNKRGSQFYYFVGYLVKILSQVGKTLKIVKWKYFPGYTKIVHSFLIEMKKKQLKDYSSIMIHSSTNLLANEQLINVLMPMVVQKINIYNNESLSKGMNIIWSYFNLITNHCKGETLPQIFNYLYFFKMIKLIFQSQSSFAIGKILALIEKFWRCFNEQFKENLAMYMMGKIFFKLFFHWSFTIRMIFHIIFISRVYYQLIEPLQEKEVQITKNSRFSFMAKHQLQERYIKIKHLIYSAEYIKKQEQNEELFSYCFKDLHKKMKKKLLARNKGTQTTINEDSPKKSLVSHIKQQYLMQNLLKYDCAAMQKTSYFVLNPTQTVLGKSQLSRIQSNNGSVQSDEAIIRRGNSFCMDEVGIQKCLKKFDIEQQIQDDECSSQYSIQERIKKQKTTNSTSQNVIAIRKMSQNDIRPQRYRSLKVQVPQISIRKKANYTYFGNEDNQLEELTDIQIKQILVAMKEYRITYGEIEKFVKQNGRAPEFDLNVQLEKDGQFEPDLLKWSLEQS